MEAPTSSSAASEERGSSTIGQRLREDGRQRIESTRRSAAEQIEGIADAFDAARSRLDATQPTLAAYTANVTDSIERLATRLRDSSVEELARDARRFAAQSPAMFLLGSAAVGVVVARFLKLSLKDDDPRTAPASSESGAGVETPVRPLSVDEDPLVAE
jgi:hypothetical protein